MKRAAPLNSEFYRGSTVEVARRLLGKSLFHFHEGVLTGGVITETEAYLGLTDPACHSYHGRKTARVLSLYKSGGHAYVYMIYGLHFCFNVVTRGTAEPEAVLVRALFPTLGLTTMRNRRGRRGSIRDENLCAGPGKLAQALGIGRDCDGLSLRGRRLWIAETGLIVAAQDIKSGPRVGIDYAGRAADWPLRFEWKAPEIIKAQELDCKSVT